MSCGLLRGAVLCEVSYGCGSFYTRHCGQNWLFILCCLFYVLPECFIIVVAWTGFHAKERL